MTGSGAVRLHHMARVSRMAAASRSSGGGGGSLAASQRGASLAERGSGKFIDPTLSLYPSINTLRSEQEDDDFSCKDCCKSGQSSVTRVCVCVHQSIIYQEPAVVIIKGFKDHEHCGFLFVGVSCMGGGGQEGSSIRR